MRLGLIVAVSLLLLFGCGRPDPYVEGRKFAEEEIGRVRSGDGRSLHCPPIDLFRSAVEDPGFVKNLRELSLAGSFDRYSGVSLSALVNLERVTLVDTEGTASFLEELPSGIKILILDRTDLTSGAGAAQRLGDTEFVESWLQELTRFDSLEEVFLNPWGRGLTRIAVDYLPKLESLKKLDIEWASEADVATLQQALPSCEVNLIVDH